MPVKILSQTTPKIVKKPEYPYLAHLEGDKSGIVIITKEGYWSVDDNAFVRWEWIQCKEEEYIPLPKGSTITIEQC